MLKVIVLLLLLTVLTIAFRPSSISLKSSSLSSSLFLYKRRNIIIIRKMFNIGYEQFASTTQFYLYGRSRCTRTGWESHSKLYDKPDILDSNIDLSNKIYMVSRKLFIIYS